MTRPEEGMTRSEGGMAIAGTDLQPTSDPTGRPLPSTRDEWEATVQELIDEGQNFRAHDLARAGAKRYPESQRLTQLRGLALLRAGALERARSVIESLCPAIDPSDDLLRRTYDNIRAAAFHFTRLR